MKLDISIYLRGGKFVMARQRKAPAPRNTASYDGPERVFRTIPEFARILGIGINQAYQAAARGEVRVTTIGGQKRISDDEIARLKRGEPPA